MSKMFLSIFMLSFLAIIISLKLFYNGAIFADEQGLSPADITGNDFWLSMDWVRLLVLFVICVISGTGILFQKQTSKKGK